MRFTRLAIISAALTVFAGTAQAQTPCNGSTSDIGSCTTTSSVDITVPYLAQAQATSIDAFTVTVNDLNTGYKLFNGASVTVKANFNYKVTATAAAGTGTKATSNLLIGTTANATGATYTGMGSGVEIGTGTAATDGGNKTFNTFHRVNLAWTTDAPGAQRYDLTYTVTAP
jgi:hypothetical protein